MYSNLLFDPHHRLDRPHVMPTIAHPEDAEQRTEKTLDNLFDDDDIDVAGRGDAEMMQLDDPQDREQKQNDIT